MSDVRERAPARNYFLQSDPIDWKQVALEAWLAPSWREAAIDYDKGRHAIVAIEPKRLARLCRLMVDDVSLDRAWHELQRNHPTPKSTIDAVVMAVRERGLKAFDEPNTARHLAACNRNARSEITRRISIIHGEGE
jgi:hypothetical protein